MKTVQVQGSFTIREREKKNKTMTTHQITHQNINRKSNGICCVPEIKTFVDYFLLQGQCSQVLKGKSHYIKFAGETVREK